MTEKTKKTPKPKLRVREDVESVDRMAEIENVETDPFPEEDEPVERAEYSTSVVSSDDPTEYKKKCIATIIGRYSVRDLLGLTHTIYGGETLDLSCVIDKLAKGEFNVADESAETRNLHMNMNGDLLPHFIDCVRMQGLEMDEGIAMRYDILHDGWDLREPKVRKLHKIKRLVLMYADGDEDLMSALTDIEWLYADKI